MFNFGIPFWKRIPFLRLLLPFITGIICQYYLRLPMFILVPIGLAGLSFIITSKLFTTSRLFIHQWIFGLGFYLLICCLGALLCNERNLKNKADWIGKNYMPGYKVIVTIQEPLVKKPRSYKAIAKIEAVANDNIIIPVTGHMLLYFKKDSLHPKLEYGSQLILCNSLQPISNSGNPGAFNYKQYCSFQGIYYQAFVTPKDYHVLNEENRNWFRSFVLNSREKVLTILRTYIKSKQELSVAEALLIGYRDDLDIELVQSYSNAGVVHIIAISGLHLGMIYGMLLWIFNLVKKLKWNRFIQPLTILIVLWLFTFIAGNTPSILRSAIMFTCIILGESLSKRTSIYNTLAVTAFLLLIIDPFYLWDVGFQLSFGAVLGIVVFQKHILNLFYFRNKLLKILWQLNAITLSAQVFTLPLVLYHFHQFPNFFLFTNLIIVPLSGIILFAEIFLLVVSFIPIIATPTGKAIEWLLWLMNTFIERADRIPYAVTDGIYISMPQILFISAAILLGSIWVIHKKRLLLYWSCIAFTFYLGLRSIDIIKSQEQRKIIVYNVPKHTAIDVVEGNSYSFMGDSSLLEDSFLRNFHLKPSRIANRISTGLLRSISIERNLILSTSKKVVIVDQALPHGVPSQKKPADVIIITKNPRLYINQLLRHYDCKLIVFDASNPLWKIRLWKKDCDSLHLPHHSVPEQGAFEMDL